MTTPLDLKADLVPRINLALQQNHVPWLRRVEISNPSDAAATDIVLAVTAHPPFCAPWTARVEAIGAGRTHVIAPIPLILQPEFLAAQAETEAGFVEIRIEAAGREPLIQRLPVEVLSPHHFGGTGVLPELLAAFVRPNAAVLAPVLADAARRLQQASGSAALDGYQSRDRLRVHQMARALYEATQATGVTYITAAAGFEESGQKIRTHEQLVGQRMGNCLDLSVFMAALLEQAGLHPLIIVIREHAFVGLWLTEFALQTPVLDDPRPVRKRIELGEALVFDSSAVAAGATFERAREFAEGYLKIEADFRLTVDIHCARSHHIRPLPFDRDHAGGPESQVTAPPMPGQAAVGGAIPSERFRPSSTAPAAASLPTTRIERWKSRLLDLSLRNRLLNYRSGAKNCELPRVDCAALEDRLASDGTYLLEPKVVLRSLGQRLAAAGGELDDAALANLTRSQQSQGVLHTDLTPAEHEKVMTDLWRLSRLALDESGAILLYVALGMLEWFESPSSQEPRRAPLVLVPVQLQRGNGGTWLLRRADDETRINTTLLKKLEADFGIQTAGMDVLPEDATGFDIAQSLHNFRHLIRDRDRWLVHEEAHLGLFSFQKFLMWLDLQAKQEALLQNPVVRHLLEGTGGAYPLAAELVGEDQLDSALDAAQTLHVVDADPSQSAAIQAALDGSSFVLQGPPGTGKSQTITNLIAQLLAHGRSVLFVSEKRAALDVVRTRLEKVGLGPFCLELHSHQASKAAVMQQLRATFEVVRTQTSDTWQRHAAELAESRGHLNAYAAALDAPGPFGQSTRGTLASLFGKEDWPRLDLPAIDLAHLSTEQVAKCQVAVDRVVVASEQAGGLAGHPWLGAGCEDWNPQWQREVERALTELQARALEAEQAQVKARQFLGLPAEVELPELQAAAGVLLESPEPPQALLDPRGFDERIAALRVWVERGQAWSAARAELGQTWREGLWQLQLTPMRMAVERWSSAFVLWAWLFLWGVRRRLRAVAVGKLPAYPRLASELQQAEWQQTEGGVLDAAANQPWLGTLWSGAATDWQRAAGVLDWAERFHRAWLAVVGQAGVAAAGARLVELATGDAVLVAPGSGKRELLAALVQAAERLDAAKLAVQNLLQLSGDRALDDRVSPQRSAELCQLWLANLPRLRNWCTLAGSLKHARSLGLSPLVQACAQGQIAADSLRKALDRSLREIWWEQRLQTDPQLSGFRAALHTDHIGAFRTLDRRSLSLARAEVLARLAARAPDAQAPGDEMGLLRRQMQLQRRHMPIRQLFAKIPTTLRRLKPCVLMSPLSVAQYLDPSIEAFDALIFDEASQIPPWDAVGAIARGKQVIVVGDSKQLPPTSFFDRSDGEDEEQPDEEAVVDTESILDEMIAARLRELQLKWHYRSRHESLIAFSNAHYYDNRLHTFPSAAHEVAGLGVKYVAVAGNYDRGGSRTNPAEARAVVDELFRLLALPDGERPTVGVVTFSQVQQRLIEELVDQRLALNPAANQHFSETAPEPVFVKNLENVQGDERDVMLFSVCYGPDLAGKVTMNFGPLNRKGGERRLNVAITRARQRLVVFSTLRWEQIDENKSRATGVAHFKAFLRYAVHGTQALASAAAVASPAEIASSFENSVRAVLAARGLQVEAQVGCSAYRIDLAVVDPLRPGTYLLGIESDGATYHRSKVARERDRLRQEVLGALGWRIYRVWSTDWWYDRAAAEAKLLQAVDQAIAAAAVGPAPAPPQPVPAVELPTAPAELAPATPVWPDQAQPFLAPAMRGQVGEREQFLAPLQRPLLAESLTAIASEFGPISCELAFRLVASAWGFGRTGEKIAAHLTGSLALLPPPRRPALVNGYLWPPNLQAETWRGFRYGVAAESRPMDQVAPEEIANAAAWVLSRALSISEAELGRETARVLGAKAVTAKASALIAAALPLLAESGRGVLTQGRWVVV